MDTRLSRYLMQNNSELSVHIPLLDIGNVGAINDNIRELKDYLQRAGRYDAKRAILHTGVINTRERSQAILAAEQVINSNLDTLEKNGIILCIENVGYLGGDLIHNFTQLAEFVDKFPKDLVCVAFDFSHANITGGVQSGIEILGERIKEIHLSDNQGETEDHHKPIGTGKIDFETMNFRTIQDNITAILEIASDNEWETNLLDSRKALQELELIE